MNDLAFENDFKIWLFESLRVNLPLEIKAFSFNLFEPAGDGKIKFGIELIGSNTFDKDNGEWACNEIWEATNRQFFIPATYSTLEFEICLTKMKSLIELSLQSNIKISEKLKNYQGIAIGFVDGDLHPINLIIQKYW